MADGEQWNKDLVLGMRGSPWEPIPGKQGMYIPVDVDDSGEDPEKDCGHEVRPTEALDDESLVETRRNIDKLHISRKAIAKYGVTTGCPGCNEIMRRGNRPGKIMYNHSDECRHRIVEHMKGYPEYRRLLDKHGFDIGMIQTGIDSSTNADKETLSIASHYRDREGRDETATWCEGASIEPDDEKTHV